MTKKDYELIANVIRKLKSVGYYVEEFDTRNVVFNWEDIAAIKLAFIEELKLNNPRFDSTKFEEYINK